MGSVILYPVLCFLSINFCKEAIGLSFDYESMKFNVNTFLINGPDKSDSFFQEKTNFERLFKISSKDLFFKSCFNLHFAIQTVRNFLIYTYYLKLHGNQWAQPLLKIFFYKNFIFNQLLERNPLIFFSFQHLFL